MQAAFTWLWLWNGAFFGYRINDALFAFTGIQAGRFHRSMIFGIDGAYLGEVRCRNRLVTDPSRKCLRHDGFEPAMSMAYRRQDDLAPLELVPGFDSFPGGRLFRSTARLVTESTQASRHHADIRVAGHATTDDNSWFRIDNRSIGS
jgi:hypothetical protein